MIDLLLGFALAFLLVRGWVRGFVREAMDLAGLVLGVVLAFRLSGPLGEVVAGLANVSADVARFVAGVVVFFVVGALAALAARLLEATAGLPGLNLANRASGAGLAAAWGVFVATLALSFASLVPVPAVVSAQLDDSVVTRALTDPDGVPQRMFTELSGDRVVQALLSLQGTLGTRRVVLEGDETLSIPPAAEDELASDPAGAALLVDRVNRSRVDAGLDPLAPAPALDAVAAAHAEDMYRAGYFSHRSPDTGRLSDRLAAAGMTYRVAGENLAIAATPSAIHDGLMDSDGHRANVLGADFRRVGVAVLDGPLGLMAVEVFTG